MDKFVKIQKDPTPQNNTNKVAYKIHCSNCDATYVGQTKRQVWTRIKEHKSVSYPLVVKDHALYSNHLIDWENIDILDKEPNYYKIIISEALHIKGQSNPLNLQTNTVFLDSSYIHRLIKYF